MTSDLFEAKMRYYQELQLQKRKLLLLVDNYPAHPVLEKLENIKLLSLPADITSVFQPMDQGVTTSLICHYHKHIVLRMIECIKKN
jgi:hypothetical protein